MSGKPKTEANQQAQDPAKAIHAKCLELGRAGELTKASLLLHEAIKKNLAGKAQGEAGKAVLGKAAVKLLSLCVELHQPPPTRLRDAFELLLNVTPDDIGDYADLVAFAARFPSVDDIPVMGLARALQWSMSRP